VITIARNAISAGPITLRAAFAASALGATLAVVSASAASASPVAVALPDKQTVVTVAKGDQLALARLSADGSIDRSYGTRGYAQTGIPRAFEATGIVARPDGTVDVAATQRPGLHVRFVNAVAQITPDGHRDPSFGSDGVAQPFTNPVLYDVGNVALSANGELLVAGTLYTQCDAVGYACVERPVVARIAADGSLDPTFGDDGLATVNASGTGDALAVGPDGKIVVGSAQDLHTPVLGRFDSDGQPDLSFGSGSGYVDVPTPASAAEIGGDGQIYVGGSDGKTLGAARLAPDGTLDTSFADSGSFSVSLGDPLVGANGAMVIASNGDILIAARVGADCRGDDRSLCRLREEIVRLNPDGVPDLDFGDGGIVQIPFSRYRPSLNLANEPGFFVEDSPGARLVMPIYLGPFRSEPFFTYSALASSVAALDDDGSLDSSFGDAGVAQLPFDWCPSHFCPRVDLKLRSGRSGTPHLALRVDQPRMQLTGVRLALSPGASLRDATVRATAGGDAVRPSSIQISGRVVSVATDRERVQSARARINGVFDAAKDAGPLSARLRVKHLAGVGSYSRKVTAVGP
jgi:uncharacterized delta-60 repeat protein